LVVAVLVARLTKVVPVVALQHSVHLPLQLVVEAVAVTAVQVLRTVVAVTAATVETELIFLPF
jgi:hypothetical protein